MKKKLAIATAAVLFSSSSAAVTYPQETGNFWLEACTSSEVFESTMCASFVRGVVDGALTMAVVAKQRPPFCIPPNGTVEQFIAIFIKFLRDNPAQRHERAASLIFVSMMQSFPCQSAGR